MGTIIKGDEECASVETNLGLAVEEFNSALTNFASRIGFRVLEVGLQKLDIGKRTYEMVGGKTLGKSTKSVSQKFTRRYRPVKRTNLAEMTTEWRSTG